MINILYEWRLAKNDSAIFFTVTDDMDKAAINALKITVDASTLPAVRKDELRKKRTCLGSDCLFVFGCWDGELVIIRRRRRRRRRRRCCCCCCYCCCYCCYCCKLWRWAFGFGIAVVICCLWLSSLFYVVLQFPHGRLPLLLLPFLLLFFFLFCCSSSSSFSVALLLHHHHHHLLLFISPSPSSFN